MIGPEAEATEPDSVDTDRTLAEWVAGRIERGAPVDAEAYAAEHPGHSEGAERVRRLAIAIGKLAACRDGSGRDPAPASGMLGDFRTIRVIGRGGMGIVYEAVQVSLNRRVALKMLPVGSADDPRRVRRFQVEARAAACLSHPHIVPVYVVGCEEGTHFFAMRFIEGRTLAEIIAEGDRIPPHAVAEFGRQAADALHYAHEQGVIHRDIKPSNLMIDGPGHLWVADFGVARIGDAGDMTLTGDVVGTPRYASPEQALGARGIVDHRTDIYSLGCTLYERLTLRPAFDGDNRLDLIGKITGGEPLPLRRIDPKIPRDLETIVLKAMAKDPADRYPTARDMADDLARFLDHRPIRARPPGPVGRAARWSRRHRPVVATAALLLTAGIIGLGVATSARVEMLRKHNAELKRALDRADQNERSTNRLWYDSQMRLAQQSLDSGQAEFAQELLERMRPEPGRDDPRGFEWHLLRRLSHREVSDFEADAFDMAVSSDGRTLAFQSWRGALHFWDLAEWREFGRTQPQMIGIDGLRFSPVGWKLATWGGKPGASGNLKLWDASSGRELAALPPIAGSVFEVAFSPGGQTLAVACLQDEGRPGYRIEFRELSPGATRPRPGADAVVCDTWAFSRGGHLVTADRGGPITLRDIATGRAERTFKVSYSGLNQLVLTPDGHTLAVSERGGVAFYDTVTGRMLGSVATQRCFHIQFSPDGDRGLGFLIGRDESVPGLIVDVRANPHLVPLEGISGNNIRAAFSPDGATLAAGGVHQPATLWDASTGRKRVAFPFRTGNVGLQRFTPDGRSLIFASGDGRVRSWHFGERTETAETLGTTNAEVWALAYSPDGSTLISAGDDHAIRLWDPAGRRLSATLKGHESLVTSLAVSKDGGKLASAGFDKTVRTWELPGGRPLAVLRGHTDRVRAVAISPDGRLVGSASSDGTVRLWNAETGSPLSICRGHSDTVRALAFSPAGQLVISSSDDQTIKGWSPEDGRELFSLSSPKHNSALVFSPDGTLLASGDDWGNVSIWDTATWSSRTSVKGSDAPVFALSFSPDGRCLAAACGDAKVRLWDPASGQVTLVLEGHAQRVDAVAFSPDGKTLASASHDGVIKLWHTNSK